jgi:chromosomal replication initiator protein
LVFAVSTLFTIPAAARAAHSLPRRRAEKSPATPLPRFVGGSENLLVRSLEEVLAGRQPAWNPVVLTGVSGTGKSLLLSLFAEEFAIAFPETQVIATTGADFARSFADACDTDSIDEFRHKFGRAQLLAIDDLHRLAGREGAEQELLHLLDALTRRGSLVVITMRHGPLDTPLCEMLQSRLSAGLVIPVAVPQAETRREIAATLAGDQQLDLPSAVLDRLSTSSFTTVPQLRHAILQLAQKAKNSTPRAPREENPGKLLDDLLREERPETRSVMKRIAAAVAKQFQQSVADLRSETRRQSVVQPRNLAMHLCRQLTGASYATIGEYFGGRDHTTVMHSCRKAAAELAENVPLQRLLDELAATVAAEER